MRALWLPRTRSRSPGHSARLSTRRSSRQTGRRLVEASVSPNTRRAYAGALRRLDVWLDGRALDDVALAAYLAELHDAGRASSSASMAVAAACFRAKLAGEPVGQLRRLARPESGAGAGQPGARLPTHRTSRGGAGSAARRARAGSDLG